jgi:AcrR family transcriptional regulator
MKLPYHRENLREELLRSGHAYVTAHGHEGLSVRALAQRVGVSPGAPYHHFPDKRSLLLALALDGFHRLHALAGAIIGQGVSPVEKVQQLAKAFLEFQAAHPRLLELMYESELTRPSIDPEIVQEQLRGFGLLRGAIASAVPRLAESAAQARTVVLWSALFGYASLAGKGLLDPFADEGEAIISEWRESLVSQSVGAALSPAV